MTLDNDFEFHSHGLNYLIKLLDYLHYFKIGEKLVNFEKGN